MKELSALQTQLFKHVGLSRCCHCTIAPSSLSLGAGNPLEQGQAPDL